MKERRLSRDEIIGQARQGLNQAKEDSRQTSEQLEATRTRFDNFPSPLRVPLKRLTRNEKRLTGLANKASENDREVYSRQEWLRLLEESKDLELQTFKTYSKGDSRGQTISVIRGKLDGARIRVNRLHTGASGNSEEKNEYVGFQAERIFDRYHSVLRDRNKKEGVKRSLLHGEHPLIYWREITQPRPVNRRRPRRLLI